MEPSMEDSGVEGRTQEEPDHRQPQRETIELPSLPKRLVSVFVSPGALTQQLAADPRWLGAMLVSAVVVGVATALIPVDLFLEAQRQAAMERGVDFPELPQRMRDLMRFVFPTFAVLSTVLFTFVFAGLYTLIFAFILGDEGRFKQYLAVLAHAWFIAAVFGLLVAPLRIATENPQFTLNLASFFFFLPDGYFLNVLRALDLSQIWATLVFAQGAHAIDRRRGFGSAAAVGLGVLLAFALVAGRFM